LSNPEIVQTVPPEIRAKVSSSVEEGTDNKCCLCLLYARMTRIAKPVFDDHVGERSTKGGSITLASDDVLKRG